MALEFLKGGFNFGTSLGGIGSLVWLIVQYVVGILLLVFVAWKFVIRPNLYKDIVDVWDITGGGIVVKADRGRWRRDRVTGTGNYILLKDKNAQLKHPNPENAIITKKGRHKYIFVKFGPGSFDYAVLPQKIYIEGEKDNMKMDLIPLADEDWAKLSVKKAADKKDVGSWFSENKGTIITVAAIVISMIIMFSLIGFAKETSTAILGASTQASAQVATQLDPIAKQLERIANKLEGVTTSGENEPPPGF